jgi:protein-tyrosine phosphatase
MAGEYPAAPNRDAALVKLSGITSVGVTHFIDLTQKHDLVAPYDQLLDEVDQNRGRALGYSRFPISDMGIPDSKELTCAILNRIDAVIEAKGVPYVHCWGGVGRTGTIVGCWLVRHGHTGEEALKLIAQKWQLMAKRSRHPRSPETPDQERYVLNWSEQAFHRGIT